jgi:hypothetical protein
LARDGKVNEKGMPSATQLALMAHEYSDVVVFTKPPALVRKVMLPVLAAIGRARGLEPMYEKYIEIDQFEAPDPAALEHLTPDGRLKPFDTPATGAPPG